MSLSTGRGRATLPRDFSTRSARPRTYRPYRGYSYGRRRPRPSVRDSAYRFPVTYTTKPELPWLVSDKPASVSETKPEPEPDVTEVELATKLHVNSCDLHIDENTKQHNTDMYECTQSGDEDGETTETELVVRRGQEFKITINFDRPYDIKRNDIAIIFSLGDEENDSVKVLKTLQLIETKATPLNRDVWSARLFATKDKSLTVSVFIPADAAIGEWAFSVRTTVDEDMIWQYNHNQEIIVLFNPWCKEDLVYLEDEKWMKEAVLNDSGVLFCGSYRNPGYRPWCFGQFQEGILDAALHLHRKVFGGAATLEMGDAVKVVRRLSKIVNSNDDSGVLTGNWSGKYEDGTSPSTWVGSVKILKQYMKTAEPVNYGQCWVFSGVLTTVCRALGIPCRSITNFESAHNTDRLFLSCDVINYKSGEDWEELNEDSVWNFHVWNEVWLSRPDLNIPEEGAPVYDGWQAIDATPQETSGGVFQCGPSPLIAIKEGRLNIGYDTSFIFAEVNGDKVEWKLHPTNGTLIELKRVKNAIGKKISTHVPTGKAGVERLDITDLYKYAEGSEKEREVYRKAEKMFRMSNYDGPASEMKKFIEAIVIEVADQTNHVGETLVFKITLKNTGELLRTVNLSLEVKYVNYRKVVTGLAVKKDFKGIILKPGEKSDHSIEVDPDASIKRPQDGFNFKLKAVANVLESENTVTESTYETLVLPELKSEGPEKCKRGDTIKVNLSFRNPLSVPLTSCKLLIEGDLKPEGETTDDLEIGNIEAGETWTTSLTLKSSKKRNYKPYRTVHFSLATYQLGTIYGGYYVQVE